MLPVFLTHFRWSVLFSSLSIQKKSRTLSTKIFSGLARSENASWRIYRYFPCTFRLFGRPISIFTCVSLISRKKQFIAKNLRMGRVRNCISVKWQNCIFLWVSENILCWIMWMTEKNPPNVFFSSTIRNFKLHKKWRKSLTQTLITMIEC